MPINNNALAVAAAVESFLIGTSSTNLFAIPTGRDVKQITISASVAGVWRFYILNTDVVSGTQQTDMMLFRLMKDMPFTISFAGLISIQGIAISFTPDANGQAAYFAIYQ